jgi:hypothetical protein
MNLLKSFTILSFAAAILIAAPQNKHNAQLQKVVQTGNQSSKLLLQTLGKNMKMHMKKGGPMDALNFCAGEASTLTDDVNTKLPKGVSVKRISSKERNLSNAATPNDQKVLDTFQNIQAANIILPKHLLVKVNDTTYKYYKPLVIKKQVCLKCHGDLKDSKLKREIASKYPLDKAMGYKMGDLRGAIVVTIDTAAK